MNQRPSLFTLILIGLGGVLVIAVVIALVMAAYLPVRSVTSSTGGTVPGGNASRIWSLSSVR